MDRINQAGEPVQEEQLFVFAGDNHSLTFADLHDAIALLSQHMEVEIWRTNATKHGITELVLKDVAL